MELTIDHYTSGVVSTFHLFQPIAECFLVKLILGDLFAKNRGVGHPDVISVDNRTIVGKLVSVVEISLFEQERFEGNLYQVCIAPEPMIIFIGLNAKRNIIVVSTKEQCHSIPDRQVAFEGIVMLLHSFFTTIRNGKTGYAEWKDSCLDADTPPLKRIKENEKGFKVVNPPFFAASMKSIIVRRDVFHEKIVV